MSQGWGLVTLLVLCLGPHHTLGFLGSTKPSPSAVRAYVLPTTSKSDVPYPYAGTSVTSALISMQPADGVQYDGADKDNVIVDILGQGPVLWSLSRWNQGDLSPRLAPRHPYAQTNLGVPPGPHGYSTSEPRDFPAQAWRPDIEKGVLLATVAQNSVEWSDGGGRFYATVACVTDSKGFGYSMRSGYFGNANPNLDITIGKAGMKGEGNAPVAVAWFPYDQGWTGGYVSAPKRYSKKEVPNWATMKSHSPDLSDDLFSVIKWSDRGARLRLPGVNSYYHGMLFLTSTDPGSNNNNVNVLGAYTKRHGKGWRIQAREDSSEDATKLVESAEHMFAFLYVPFSATGLIGGNIDRDGTVLGSSGDFEVAREDTGKYTILINGVPKLPKDGVLLLQVIGRDTDERKFAQHAFLSYNYTDSGKLVVEAHEVEYVKHGETMEETFPSVDCGFSFMWVDFNFPLTPEIEMFTGKLPARKSSVRFWVGFLIGAAMAILGTLLLARGIPQLAFEPLPAVPWQHLRWAYPDRNFWAFRRAEPLVPAEYEEEELLRGPYEPASNSN